MLQTGADSLPWAGAPCPPPPSEPQATGQPGARAKGGEKGMGVVGRRQRQLEGGEGGKGERRRKGEAARLCLAVSTNALLLCPDRAPRVVRLESLWAPHASFCALPSATAPPWALPWQP